jgi:hypothetical protein
LAASKAVAPELLKCRQVKSILFLLLLLLLLLGWHPTTIAAAVYNPWLLPAASLLLLQLQGAWCGGFCNHFNAHSIQGCTGWHQLPSLSQQLCLDAFEHA